MARQIKRAVVKTNPLDTLDATVVVDPAYQPGSSRPFLVTAPSPDLTKLRTLNTKTELLYLVALVFFTFSVRMYNLATPESVVFDEVHFGGFARKYILGKFFMDVHPPLAKMAYAAMGVLGGFNGEFLFKNIGDVYPVGAPYVLMRTFPAVLGVLTVVLFYLTLRVSGCRQLVSLITAAAFAVENSNITISRYILLDSPLLFAIALAVYGFKKFEIEMPFSTKWYKALIITGIGLGLAVASKWVGLFTIAWVGLCSLVHMWLIFGDLSVPPLRVASHAAFRGVFLLGIPALIYVLSFVVHFRTLSLEGEGSGFMTSGFRSTLSDNTIPSNLLADVGVRSTVTIRQFGNTNGYLHSHAHFYQTGSKQQQITMYPHLDENNKWYLELYNTTEDPLVFQPLRDGVKIRLKHVVTQKRLHSHDEKPPVAHQDWQKETTCYGFEGFEGDANDDFIVEIVKHKSKPGVAQEQVRALDTVFRLRHAMTGCHIFSSNNKLPDWGFKQTEVTCAGQGKRHLEEFYVEDNTNPYLGADADRVSYPTPSFWSKFLESHATMWRVNQGLTGSHNWQSSPESWPLLQRGINYWAKDSAHVYFVGNAVVWYASTLAVVVGVVQILSSIIRWQRGVAIATDPHVFNYNLQVFGYLLGWAVHYAPSFLMGRQMFIHHYLPALYFALLAMGHMFDIVVSVLFSKRRNVGYGVLGVFLLGSVAFYYRYSALVYGTQWTRGKCQAAKFLNMDFDCLKYPVDYAGYAALSEKKEEEKISWNSATAVAVGDVAAVPQAGEAQIVKAVPEDNSEGSVSPAVVPESPAAPVEVVEAPVAPEDDNNGTVGLADAAVAVDVDTKGEKPVSPEGNSIPVAAEDEAVHLTKEESAGAQEVKQQVVDQAQQVQAIVEPVAEQVQAAAEPVAEQVQAVAEPVAEQVQAVAEPIVEQVQVAAEPIVEQVQVAAEPIVEQVRVAVEPVA